MNGQAPSSGVEESAGHGTRPSPSGQRPAGARQLWPVPGAVALGGAVGAVARYGVSLLWPTPSGAFPWTTLCVNAAGCAVIGVFMVVIGEVRPAHRLVQPFFGTGVLGGFTTFSAYAVDIVHLIRGGSAWTGLVYLVLTPAVALTAVSAAAMTTRRVTAGRRP